MGADRQPQAGAKLSKSPSRPEQARLSGAGPNGIPNGPCHTQLNRIMARAIEIIGSAISLVNPDRQRNLHTVALS